MAHFSTAFKLEHFVKPSMFVELLVQWFRGMRDFPFTREITTILNSDNFDKEEGDSSISYRRIAQADSQVIGVRYVYSVDATIWETTAIYRVSGTQAPEFSIKVDSVAGMAKPVLPRPRRPYLVKTIIKNGWSGYDEKIKIKDKAWSLNYSDLEFVSEIFNNQIAHRLPIIYASLTRDEKYLLDCEKMAWDLGGVAHVFCEPSRKFSVQLARRVQYRNPYMGAISVVFPGGQIVRYLPDDFDSAGLENIKAECVAATSNLRKGDYASWGYVKQQEASLSLQKLKADKSEDVEAYIAGFDQQLEYLKSEILARDSEINQLKVQLHAFRNTYSVSELNFPDIFRFDRFYANELNVIISRAFELLRDSSAPGRRFHEVSNLILSNLQGFSRACEIEMPIKKCFSEYEKMNAAKRKELESLGFAVSENGKHYKLVFLNNPTYTFSLSKTPSDHRSSKNMASEVTNKLFT